MPWQATSKFRLSLDYYKQLQSDWLTYLSPWRRFGTHFGAIWILIGVAIIFYSESAKAVGLAFVVAGLFQIFRHFKHQRKWISDRLKEKSFDHEVEIQFTEDRINIKGPQGTGFCKWDAFERCRITPNGLFLWPRKGINIYIPDSSLTPVEAKAKIAEKIRAAQPAPETGGEE